MKIEFYFDPACPFCWITSRWINQVAQDRDLTINWQPFSLALKNNHLLQRSGESDHAPDHRSSHRILRVIEAAAADGADRGKLYTDFGKIHHIDGDNYDAMAIDIVLGINKLPGELAGAADDESLDESIKSSMAQALNLTGQDAGVPIIVFEQSDGQKAGYFGPVLQSLPDQATSLQIWDGLVKLATVSDFYELKRTRPSGKPNTNSTRQTIGAAIC